MPEAKKARYDEACHAGSDGAHFESILQEFTEVQRKLEEVRGPFLRQKSDGGDYS